MRTDYIIENVDGVYVTYRYVNDGWSMGWTLVKAIFWFCFIVLVLALSI